jgi:hypothetical protein
MRTRRTQDAMPSKETYAGVLEKDFLRSYQAESASRQTHRKEQLPRAILLLS